MSRAKRQAAYGAGRRAETLAAWLLRAKGFRVLARGYRVPVGEIDVIARRGRVLVAVEIKARARLEDALEAVTLRQRRRIERALAQFVARNRRLSALAWRFDVIAVVPGRLPTHIIDAWRPDSHPGAR